MGEDFKSGYQVGSFDMRFRWERMQKTYNWNLKYYICFCVIQTADGWSVFSFDKKMGVVG